MRLHRRDGFTLLELLIVVAIVAILAGLCAHHVLQARAVANEASAIGTLRAISSGQSGFAATCGNGFYAGTLTTLVDGKYISPDANLSPKSGFNFVLTPGTVSGVPDCTGAGSRLAFYATAVPVSSSTGNRGFATNQHGTIWQDTTGIAPTEPFTQTASRSPLQ